MRTETNNKLYASEFSKRDRLNILSDTEPDKYHYQNNSLKALRCSAIFRFTQVVS